MYFASNRKTDENKGGEVQDDSSKKVFNDQDQTKFLSDIYQAVKEYMDQLQEIQRIQLLDITYVLFLTMNNVLATPISHSKQLQLNYLINIFFSELATGELNDSWTSLGISIIVLVVVFLLGPLIFMSNRNIALIGEVANFL